MGNVLVSIGISVIIGCGIGMWSAHKEIMRRKDRMFEAYFHQWRKK